MPESGALPALSRVSPLLVARAFPRNSMGKRGVCVAQPRVDLPVQGNVAEHNFPSAGVMEMQSPSPANSCQSNPGLGFPPGVCLRVGLL